MCKVSWIRAVELFVASIAKISEFGRRLLGSLIHSKDGMKCKLFMSGVDDGRRSVER